jgi:hypothetical protein
LNRPRDFPLVIAAFHRHNAVMSRARSDVKFKPAEWKVLPEWYVVASFPDGAELRISGAFKTEADAKAWIVSSSAKWLTEHSARNSA